MGWFDDLKSEVMAFFEKATEKDIQLALEKSNYDFYKDIDVPILAFHERIHEWIGMLSFRVSFRISKKMMIQNERIYIEEKMTISADNYGYSLAA